MAKTVKTPKGTELPLTNLKGKDYLMVAYRLQWFNEVVDSFTMNSEIIKLTDDAAVVKTTVAVFDKDGKMVKSASGTKSETKKDFPDFLEKAETGSLGRALAMLGYGTQFALADLDEGDRIVDSPLASAKTVVTGVASATNGATAPTPFITRSRRKAVDNGSATSGDEL